MEESFRGKAEGSEGEDHERTMGLEQGLVRVRTVAPRRGFREKAKVQETSEELHGDLTVGGVSLAIRQGLWASGSISWSTSDSLTSITPGAFRLEEAHTRKQTPPMVPEGSDPFKGVSFQILESYRFSLQL